MLIDQYKRENNFLCTQQSVIIIAVLRRRKTGGEKNKCEWTTYREENIERNIFRWWCDEVDIICVCV